MKLLTVLSLLSLSLGAQQLTLLGDTYVDSIGANHGTSSSMIVGGGNGAQALLQFDIGTLPTGTTAANVAKAVLFVYVNTVGSTGNITVNEAASAWTERTVTTAPSVGSSVAATSVANDTYPGFLAIDVTAAVQDWLNGVSNFGLIISTGPLPNAVVLLDTKESTSTSHPASLMVSLH